MLEKSFYKLMNDYREQKQMYIDTVNSQQEMAEQLVMSDEDLSEEEKEKQLAEIKRSSEIMLNSVESNDLNQSEARLVNQINDYSEKPNRLNEIIETLRQKMEQTDDESKIAIYAEKISDIEDSTNLTTFKKYKPCMNKQSLFKVYDRNMKDLQKKIAVNKRFLFPSCYTLKRCIEEITEPHLSKRESKILASYMFMFMLQSKNSLLNYFMLNNIINFNELEMEHQTKLRDNLILISKNI